MELEERNYNAIKSDDYDIRPSIMEITIGGNGDYYISIKELKNGIVYDNSCRVSTSGGYNNQIIKIALANLHKALNEEIDFIQQNNNKTFIDKVMADLFHCHDYRAMYQFYEETIKKHIV